MSAQIIETVYIGRDNTIDLLLTEDGVSIDHSLITRVIVDLNDTAGTTIDSDVSPGAFSWDEGKLVLSLGHEGIATGSYNADLIVYDPINTSGIQWQPRVGILVTNG